MNAALIALALTLQTPAADTHIEAFLNGDDAARGELLKLGVRAIRPLQKVREKSPDKVDALVRDLQKGVMIPPESPVARRLEAKVTLRGATARIHDDPERRRMDWDDIRAAIPCPIVVMPFDPKEATAMSATITLTDRPAREALDQLFLQTGLDYGYFHNAVVLAPPDRLWPSDPKSAPPFRDASTLRTPDPVDAAVLKALQSRRIPALRQVDAPLALLAELILNRDVEVAFAAPEAKAAVIPIIDAEEIAAFDALCLVAQAAGYDLAIAEGKAVVRPKAK